MENKENKPQGLPENAYRKLKKGEEYKPLLSPDKNYPEITVWSVTIGLVMTIIFSAAAAYLGLKVGQVFEAAIPIAILAVGLSSVLKKNQALGQNVIIQSIGSCSGVIELQTPIREMAFRDWHPVAREQPSVATIVTRVSPRT